MIAPVLEVIYIQLYPRSSSFSVEVSLTNQTHNLLGRTCGNQDFVQGVCINGVQQVLIIRLLEITLRQLLNHNLRRENVSFLNQLRCRNVTDNRTIYCPVIHTRLEDGKRVFRSSSEKIAAVSVSRKMLSGREEVTLDRIVRFIKINGVDFDVCLLYFVQRMIGGEDDAVLTCCASNISEQVNLLRISGVEILNITTVNVHHMGVSGRNQLKKFFAELFCKQNTRSNNNNGGASWNRLLMNSILNHADGLTATRGDDDLSFVVLQHCVNRSLLMWAKGDGQVGVPFSME